VVDRWVQVSVSIFVCQPLRTQAVVGLVTQHVAIYRRPHTLSAPFNFSYILRFWAICSGRLDYFYLLIELLLEEHETAWDRYAMRASLCFYLFIFSEKWTRKDMKTYGTVRYLKDIGCINHLRFGQIMLNKDYKTPSQKRLCLPPEGSQGVKLLYECATTPSF
jgi:hypothetical protein